MPIVMHLPNFYRASAYWHTILI